MFVYKRGIPTTLQGYSGDSRYWTTIDWGLACRESSSGTDVNNVLLKWLPRADFDRLASGGNETVMFSGAACHKAGQAKLAGFYLKPNISWILSYSTCLELGQDYRFGPEGKRCTGVAKHLLSLA